MAKVRFWEWDERLNHPSYYLGNDITTLLMDGKISPSTRDNEYHSKDDPTIMILSAGGVVNSVMFLDVSNIFFVPYDTSTEETDLHPLEYELNKILKPIQELNNGQMPPFSYKKTDVFLLSFKDDQPSVAMLVRKKTNE